MLPKAVCWQRCYMMYRDQQDRILTVRGESSLHLLEVKILVTHFINSELDFTLHSSKMKQNKTHCFPYWFLSQRFFTWAFVHITSVCFFYGSEKSYVQYNRVHGLVEKCADHCDTKVHVISEAYNKVVNTTCRLLCSGSWQFNQDLCTTWFCLDSWWCGKGGMHRMVQASWLCFY